MSVHRCLRLASSALALLGVASLGACLTLDAFVFNPVPVDEYRWDDDDPCDEKLSGEIARSLEELGGPPASCHPSLVPPENRIEGFVDAEGTRIHYVYAHQPGATTTVLYSHGNYANLGYYWDRVELMWGWGYNVLVYDYPGYGRSEGEPDEAGVYAAAVAMTELLTELPDVDPERVFFYGYSLGGAPTYEIALRAHEGRIDLQPRGIITEAAWCNLETIASETSVVGLGKDYLLSYEFDSCAKIAQLDLELPIMIMHGTADKTVIVENGRLLRKAAATEVEFHQVEGGEHYNLPVVAEDYEGWITEFLDR